jgi:hypothetical protein
MFSGHPVHKLNLSDQEDVCIHGPYFHLAVFPGLVRPSWIMGIKICPVYGDFGAVSIGCHVIIRSSGRGQSAGCADYFGEQYAQHSRYAGKSGGGQRLRVLCARYFLSVAS